ncbi:zinc ribbon domain-containing protein [Streptomyces sp. NPDC001544]|uniref:NADase-type glycan-binding domain-containing protein n=1 Tax=Streptomyces sp. NPDC001544 TaxID=3364584 RepID=UPI0036C1A883
MTTTQNCAECGTRAEPGQSFCDACGAVLGWTDRAGARVTSGAVTASAGGSGPRSGDAAAGDSGNAVATRPGTPAVSGDDPADAREDGPASGSGPTASSPAEPAAPDAGPGWDAFSRRDGGTGLARSPRDLLGSATANGGTDTAPDGHDESESAPQATAGDTSAVDETAPTEPVPAGPAPDASAARTAADPEGMTDRARRLLVPVTDPEPRPAADPAVAPVLPGRPAPQRPQAVRAPGEELGADGGIPCPWCATRNRPERHYCARCAMPMAGDGQTPGRLPWWRRLLRSGDREAPWAGDRPRLRRTFDRVLGWLAAAVVLALLIVLAINIPAGVQATRDHFAKRAPVAPDKVAASRSYPGHKPELAFDKLNNTWWGPGVSESGQGQWIEARFDEPTRLLDVIITPGTSTHADQLSKSALPHRVEARVTTAAGKTRTVDLTLDQGAGAQRRPFRVGEVTAVRFTLESAYQTSASKQVAIAEIEFFGPSHGN